MKTEPFEYEIKFAAEEDLDALIATALVFWHESKHSENDSQDPAKYRAWLSRHIKEDCVRIILAVDGATIAGYFMLYATADYKSRLDGEMYQFFVHPRYRASGVARELVRMAVQIFDDWGCDVSYAIASPEIGNMELKEFRNLFAKFGYVETGIVMTRRIIDGRQ